MQKENESFQLMKHLGTGGFAQTWKAKVLDPMLAAKWGFDEVAVKIPLNREKEIALKDEIQLNGYLYMKLTEAETRNIVKYLSFDKFDGWIVMVMKYVRGGNLRSLMGWAGTRRAIGAGRTEAVIRGVLSGLAVLHRNSIIHRDIKPENILMEGEIPKISDLGIGRILKPYEMASTTTGSICYMAPEVLHKITRASAPLLTPIYGRRE